MAASCPVAPRDRVIGSLIEALPVGVLVFDRRGQVLQANPAAAATLHCPLDDLIGSPLHSYLAPLDVERESDLLSAVPDDSGPFHVVRCQMRRATKRRQHCELVIAVAPDQPSPPSEWVAVVREPTTSGAADPRVRESVKMEAVRTMAKHVANNFNNALVGIAGHIEAARHLRDTATPARNREIEAALAETKRAARIVRYLTSVTEPAPSHRRLIDPAGIVEDGVQAIRAELGPSITVDVELDHEDWIVHADRQQLTDILINLAHNARDALPDGGRLRISTTRTVATPNDRETPADLSGREFVCIGVRDDGSGIPSDVLPHIFEPFFSTKGDYGTGLGLASVYHVLKQHEGGVTVESTPGTGTTFHIYLPRAAGRPDHDRQPQTGGTVSGTEAVLVIDDEASVRRIVRRVLEKHGYTVFEAPDGPSGLNMLDEPEPVIALVLLDILMPGMSGWEVLAAIQDRHPSLPVVLQSGYVVGEEECLRDSNKARAFLRKPYELPELVQTVRQVLDGTIEDA